MGERLEGGGYMKQRVLDAGMRSEVGRRLNLGGNDGGEVVLIRMMSEMKG